MASLACQRAGGTCIGSGLARICHEPLDAGSSAVVAILQPPECPSPRLWSYCAANDRNSLLGNTSGTTGVEGRRYSTSAHEGGPSVCVFPETAQLLQRSEGVLRNHHNSSVAQWPEATHRTQVVGGEASTLHVDLQAMDDDTASTAFPSLSSSSDEEELSSNTSSEALSDPTASPEHVDGPLDCLAALNEALPAKRGLSRYFAGKSQSFSCLTDVRSVTDLAKPLNPFVKRRKTDSFTLGKETCYRPKSLPASSISKRPVNSHRKSYHAATVPKSVPQEMIHTIATDCLPNSIPLKCFSSPELGEAGL